MANKNNFRKACLILGVALIVLVCVSLPIVSGRGKVIQNSEKLSADISIGDLTAKQLYELAPRSLEFKKVISAQALTLYGCERQLDGTFACPRGER